MINLECFAVLMEIALSLQRFKNILRQGSEFQNHSKVCDSNQHCEDNSDEDNCNLITYNAKYDKYKAPFERTRFEKRDFSLKSIFNHTSSGSEKI